MLHASEVQNYNAVQSEVKDWLITDLDNTVFTPDLVNSTDKMLAKQATDESFYLLRAKATLELGSHWLKDADGKQAMSKWLGYRFAVNAWNKTIIDGTTSSKVIMRPVEQEIPAIIKSIQTKGFRVIALTAREPSLQKSTEQTLSHLDINLKTNSPLLEEVTYKSIEEDPLEERTAVWSQGILYVGRGHGSTNHKGKMFLAWLKEAKLAKPKHVVFIDDRAEHCLGMKQELEREGIPTTAFIYTQIKAL